MAGDEQVQKSTEQVEQKIDASKLTDEQKEQAKRGYAEWVKEKGHDLYESWIPWIEDQYLSWFTKDNKTSYATKSEPALPVPPVSARVPIVTQLALIYAKYMSAEQLDKTKVTNIEGVNKLQDDLNSLVSNQFGKGGLLQPVGDAASKEGINRAEREGKDSKGNYLPSSMSSVEDAGQSAASGVTEGAKTGGGYLSSAGGYVSSAGSSVYSGAKGAAGYVGGMFGGKKDTTGAADEAAQNVEGEQKATPAAQQPQQQKPRTMVDQAEEESKAAQAGSQQAPKADTSAAQQATQPVTDAASKGAGAVQDGAKAGISGAGNVAKGTGGYVTGMFGKKS